MTLLDQLGFDNTYAIGVPQALAEEYGLNCISDLIPIAGQLTFGAEQEFFTLEGSMIRSLHRGLWAAFQRGQACGHGAEVCCH